MSCVHYICIYYSTSSVSKAHEDMSEGRREAGRERGREGRQQWQVLKVGKAWGRRDLVLVENLLFIPPVSFTKSSQQLFEAGILICNY